MGADFNAVLRRIQGVAAGQRNRNLTDAELLEHFTAGQDQSAFAALMERHGPMVLGVCRHVLHQHEDAEDAFQVTFLVLARHAGSIRKRQSVANWLHGVAHRTALAARRAALRRQAHERRTEDMGRCNAADGLEWREVQAALEEEIERLPATYRAPFVLCCLEGRTRVEVSRELGIGEGTVSSRIGRARKQLQERLARRGIALTAVLGALTLTPNTVPAALAASTLKAALQYAAGQAAGGLIAANAVTVLDAVLHGLFVTKCKHGLVVVLLLAGLTGTGIVVGAGAVQSRRGAPPTIDAHLKEVRQLVFPPQPANRDEPRLDSDGNPLPSGALARFGSMRWRHAGAVRGLALTSDGQLLASAGRDLSVRVWNTASGKELQRFTQAGHFFAVAISADDRLLAGAGQDVDRLDGDQAVVRIWELATGKERQRLTLEHPGEPHAVAFTPDGRRVAAVGQDGNIALWNVATGELVAMLPTRLGDAVGFAMAPDGRTLAAGGQNQELRLWDVATGQPLRRFIASEHRPSGPAAILNQLLRGNTTQRRLPSIHAVAFSPNGKLLASADADGTIRLWNPASGDEVRRCEGRRSPVRTLAFSPDGRHLLSGGDDYELHLWDVAQGEEIRKFPGNLRAIQALAIFPDGKRAVSGGDDFRIRFWDLDTGRELQRSDDHQGWIHTVVYSPDGKTVAVSGLDNTIRIWDVASRQEIRRIKAGMIAISFLAFAPDGQTLAAAGGDLVVRVFDTATGEERSRFPQLRTTAIAYSPDGKLLAVASFDGAIHLLDTASGQELPALVQSETPLGFLAFGPGGRTLIGGVRDQTIRVWDMTTGLELVRMRGGSDPRFLMAVTADVRTAAALDKDGIMHLWDLATGQERQQFKVAGELHSLAISPGGRWLAWGEGQSDICIWDLNAGRIAGKLHGHHGWVRGLTFSPDGKVLASGSGDSTVVLWDTAAAAAQGSVQR